MSFAKINQASSTNLCKKTSEIHQYESDFALKLWSKIINLGNINQVLSTKLCKKTPDFQQMNYFLGQFYVKKSQIWSK